MKKTIKIFFSLVFFVVYINIFFWILVGIGHNPIKTFYQKGAIIKIGPVALVFGHGGWNEKNGIVFHETTVLGEDINTKNLVEQLHQDGAQYIWGTWCFAGDFGNILEIDKFSGKKNFWPEYVSYSGTGITVPVYMGLWFVRFNFGKPSDVDTNRIKPKIIHLDLYPEKFKYKNLENRVFSITADDSVFILNSLKIEEMYLYPDSLRFFYKETGIETLTEKEFFQPDDDFKVVVSKKVAVLCGVAYKRGELFLVLLKIYPIIKIGDNYFGATTKVFD